MKKLALISMLSLSSLSFTVMAVTQEDVDKAISSAQETLNAAGATGFQWRDSSKILKQAKKAAEGGDMDAALALAEKARFQGEAAIAQSQREANPGPRF